MTLSMKLFSAYSFYSIVYMRKCSTNLKQNTQTSCGTGRFLIIWSIFCSRPCKFSYVHLSAVLWTPHIVVRGKVTWTKHCYRFVHSPEHNHTKTQSTHKSLWESGYSVFFFSSSTHPTKLPASLTLHKWVQHKQGTTHYWGNGASSSFQWTQILLTKFSGPDFFTGFCTDTCICTQTQNSPSQNNTHLYLPCKMEIATSGTKAVKNQAPPASCFKNHEMNSLSTYQISVPLLEHQNHHQPGIICPPELCWGPNWSCWP